MLVLFLTGSSFNWINRSLMYNKIHTAILKQYMDDKVMREFTRKNILAFAGSSVSKTDIIDVSDSTFFLTCLNNNTDEIITHAFQDGIVEFLKSIDKNYDGKIIVIVPNDAKIPSLCGIVACAQQIAEYTGGVMFKTIDELDEAMPLVS